MCGISDDKSLLYEVIHGNEIVDACKNCLLKENLMIVKTPQILQKEVQQAQGTRFKEAIKEFERQKKTPVSFPLKKKETTLREIIERNYREKNLGMAKSREDLVDNFHWVIMRARRFKKLTQEQLAKEISEPVGAIELAEKGILPEGNYRFAEKLENFLGITLIKKEKYEEIIPSSFNLKSIRGEKSEKSEMSKPKEMTISDLRDIANKESVEKKEAYGKKLEENKELSDEKIHNLIFGGKKTKSL